MIPAAFHAHTLTGMRVQVLQNEDSSCSIGECNTSNTTSTPNISDVCTAAAVDTACARGSVLLITYWYTSISTYKGTVCLSKRTYRYSNEARMNVLSVEQYHTTYRSPACAQTKPGRATPTSPTITYIQSVVVRFRCLLDYYDGVYMSGGSLLSARHTIPLIAFAYQYY